MERKERDSKGGVGWKEKRGIEREEWDGKRREG